MSDAVVEVAGLTKRFGAFFAWMLERVRVMGYLGRLGMESP